MPGYKPRGSCAERLCLCGCGVMFEPHHPIQKYTRMCAPKVQARQKAAVRKSKGCKPGGRKLGTPEHIVRALTVPRDRVPVCVACCNLPHARPLFGCRTCGLPHSDKWEIIEGAPVISSSARLALGR